PRINAGQPLQGRYTPTTARTPHPNTATHRWIFRTIRFDAPFVRIATAAETVAELAANRIASSSPSIDLDAFQERTRRSQKKFTHVALSQHLCSGPPVFQEGAARCIMSQNESRGAPMSEAIDDTILFKDYTADDLHALLAP